jgi:hypothetical protein
MIVDNERRQGGGFQCFLNDFNDFLFHMWMLSRTEFDFE